jgi:hypothetical protein
MREEGQPLLETQPTPPEDLDLFRLARLLLLMREVRGLKRARALDIERLAIYDFFAANPFLLFARETTAGTRLHVAEQRFVARRALLSWIRCHRFLDPRGTPETRRRCGSPSIERTTASISF